MAGPAVIPPEDLATAPGRCGTALQSPPHDAPLFYGRVVAVEGNYVKFRRGAQYRDRWYHRDHVTLHEPSTDTNPL